MAAFHTYIHDRREQPYGKIVYMRFDTSEEDGLRIKALFEELELPVKVKVLQVAEVADGN